MSKYLVVGASSGIGKALATSLNENGHEVYTAQRSTGNFSEGGIEEQEFDVLGDQGLNLPEELDGIAYCPGTINLKPFHRLNEEDFINDYQINLIGAAKVIQQSLSALKKSDSPSIILFSTVAVAQGMPFHASVAAAKGAVEGFTKSLAAELAPKVRVNAIAPSVTDTPLASKILSNDSKKEASNKRHPLQRYGETSDIIPLAEFLLTEKSSWITGQIIGVDGGMSTVRNF